MGTPIDAQHKRKNYTLKTFSFLHSHNDHIAASLPTLLVIDSGCYKIRLQHHMMDKR
jgi:hypothetical protein